MGGQGDAFVFDGGGPQRSLVCFDLGKHTIRWQQAVNSSGTMAIADGKLYIPMGDRIAVLDEATGASVGQMIAGNNVALANNILVTGNLVFASSATNTYAFDRSTLAQVWSVNYGGNLAWDAHRLLISDAKTIRSYNTIPTNLITANITPAPLQANGIAVGDKTYDGATGTPVNADNASISGIIGGDSVSLDAAGARGTFASKDVGRGIDVTITGLVLAGPQASDYTITGTAKGNIVPRPHRKRNCRAR